MDILQVQLTEEEFQAGQDLLNHIDSHENKSSNVKNNSIPTTTSSVEPLDRLPIKIIIKTEHINQTDLTLLRNANHVTTFMVTVKPKYTFWKSSGFFLYIKNRSIPNIHSSFPFNLLQQNDIPYEVTLIKALYKDHYQNPVSIIPNTSQAHFNTLPTPDFIADNSKPAEINLIFRLNALTPRETSPTSAFLQATRTLALNDSMDSLSLISMLLSAFQEYRTSIRQETVSRPHPLFQTPIPPPANYSSPRSKHLKTPYSRF